MPKSPCSFHHGPIGGPLLRNLAVTRWRGNALIFPQSTTIVPISRVLNRLRKRDIYIYIWQKERRWNPWKCPNHTSETVRPHFRLTIRLNFRLVFGQWSWQTYTIKQPNSDDVRESHTTIQTKLHKTACRCQIGAGWENLDSSIRGFPRQFPRLWPSPPSKVNYPNHFEE